MIIVMDRLIPSLPLKEQHSYIFDPCYENDVYHAYKGPHSILVPVRYPNDIRFTATIRRTGSYNGYWFCSAGTSMVSELS